MSTEIGYGQQLMTDICEALLGMHGERNYRPDWLFGMEIDLYFPTLGIGMEFQGDQHYVPIYGADCLNGQQRRDARKKEIVKLRGEALLCIDSIDLCPRVIKGKLRAIRTARKATFKLANAETLLHFAPRCTEYRKHMKAKYSSPTALRRKSAARIIEILESGQPFRSMHHGILSKTETGKKWLTSKGIVPLPPRERRARN